MHRADSGTAARFPAATKRKNREMKQARSNLYQKLTDAVLGIHEWYVSGRQTEFLTGYEADEAEVDRTDRSLKRWSRLRALSANAWLP